MAYPGITAERRQIDLLSGTSGTQLQEPGKGLQVTDIDHLANIAFDIGRDIVGQPLVVGDGAVIGARIGPLPQHRVEGVRRIIEGTQLLEIRWQQHKNTAATGQGL